VWMVEAFEDMDLGVQVILQLLVELLQVNRFDRYVGAGFLPTPSTVSKSLEEVGVVQK